MIRALAFLAALALAPALTACDTASGGDGGGGGAFPGEGDSFPAATVQDCDGADVALADWIAQHDVVFISFGAKWCTACQEEAPRLNEELVDGLAGRSVGVAQILIEDDPGVAPPLSLCASWRDGLNARYTVLVDTTRQTVPQHFGDAVGTLPVHFVVQGDGTIRLKAVGELPANIKSIVEGWIP